MWSTQTHQCWILRQLPCLHKTHNIILLLFHQVVNQRQINMHTLNVLKVKLQPIRSVHRGRWAQKMLPILLHHVNQVLIHPFMCFLPRPYLLQARQSNHSPQHVPYRAESRSGVVSQECPLPTFFWTGCLILLSFTCCSTSYSVSLT